jgi:hypothetical protein
MCDRMRKPNRTKLLNEIGEGVAQIGCLFSIFIPTAYHDIQVCRRHNRNALKQKRILGTPKPSPAAVGKATLGSVAPKQSGATHA